MKALITIVLLGLNLVFVRAQTLNLSGKVDEQITKVTVLAFNAETTSYDQIEQVEAKNGEYQLDLKFDQPNLYQIDFSGAKKVMMSYVNEDKVQVNFTSGQVQIWGSETSADIQNFDAQNGALQQKHFAQLKRDADAAMASGDEAAMADIQKRSAAAIQAFLPELRSWIESKGASPAGYMAIQYSDFNKELDYISDQLVRFEKELPNSPVTKALSAQVYRSKVLSIGQTPPSFAAVDKNDNAFDYADYNGKILLVDFWAAWCRACRIENPQFVELYKEFNKEGLEIVSISQDRDVDTWNKAIEKDGVGLWTNIQDKTKEISDLYAVSSLPQNLVIGKDGRIIGKNVTAEQLKQMLSKLL